MVRVRFAVKYYRICHVFRLDERARVARTRRARVGEGLTNS